VSWGNWATVADLGTALGTLILAAATFSAVKSANLTARVIQQSLLVGLRPVMMSSRLGSRPRADTGTSTDPTRGNP